MLTSNSNLKKTWSEMTENERLFEIKRLIASRNMRLLQIIFENVLNSDLSVLDWWNELTDAILQSTDDNLKPIITINNGNNTEKADLEDNLESN